MRSLRFPLTVQPPPGAQPDWDDPINDGLKFWAPMNEGAGQQVSDVSGYGNHGTLTAMEPSTDWVGGQNGGSLELLTDDYIIIPDSASLTFLQCTFACWLRIPSAAGTGGIFSQYSYPSSKANGYWHGYSAGSYYACFGDGIADGWKVQISTPVVDAGWHLFVVTHDGVNTVLYIDGIAKATSFMAMMLTHVSSQLEMGRDNRLGSNYFNGQMQNARIWSLAKSESVACRLFCEPWAGLWTPSGIEYSFPVWTSAFGPR